LCMRNSYVLEVPVNHNSRKSYINNITFSYSCGSRERLLALFSTTQT